MNIFSVAFGVSVLLIAAGCTTSRPDSRSASPDEVRAAIETRLPAQLADRAGWARDMQVAFGAQGISSSDENICAVIAVIEQESSFQVSPVVPGLARIARTEIDRRAAALHIPGFVIDAALSIRSSSGKTYAERLAGVRTETELSAIFEDFIDLAPLGKQLFGGFNPVRTGGPMQVSVEFAQAHAKDYPYPVSEGIRDEVFSRRGGVYFGSAHLLGYDTHYDKIIYRFADFNAGHYASRNAAFQNAVVRASGIALALDGDLIIPGSNKVGATELAVRTLRSQLNMNDSAIREALMRSDSLDFEETTLYKRTFDIADRAAKQALPRAVLPGIKLESPKITRALTTAWFANRVQDRWTRCMR